MQENAKIYAKFSVGTSYKLAPAGTVNFLTNSVHQTKSKKS